MINILFKKFKKSYIIIILLTLLYSISHLLILNMYNGVDSVRNIDEFFNLSTIFFLSWVIKNFVRYNINIIGIKTDIEAKEFFTNKFISRIFYEKFSDLEKKGDEYFNTLYNRDIERVSNFTSKIYIKFLLGSILFLVCFLYCMNLSYFLTVVILILSLLSVAITKHFEKHIQEVEEENMVLFENLSKLMISLKTNKIVITIEKIGDFIKGKIYDDWEKLKNENEKQIKLHSKVEALNFGVGMIVNTIWIVLALYLMYIDKLTIGSFIVFMSLSEIFNWPFFEYPFIKIEYIQTKQSLKKLEDYNRIDAKISRDLIFEKLNIEDLTYSYEKKNLYYPNFSINKGDWIAITGQSGTGKTTLLKVLMGLYEKNSGKILLNGKNTNRAYCEIKIGYVPQVIEIYSNESKDFNLTLMEQDLQKDNLINSIFKIKYNENNKYSGGELKRIGLYRALYDNPEILILDEYSAGLDDLNLNVSLELLKSLDKTIIYVTHDKRIIEWCNKKVEIYG